MARLQDFQTVTPTSSDKLLVVQSQGQGLVPYGSKLDSANPTGTGALSLNRKANTTTGIYSVAIGYNNEASGSYSHAEGAATTASGDYGSHAEGNSTTASGAGSHAQGVGTIANHLGQNVFGTYNTADTSTAGPSSRGNYIEVVGNGTSGSARSNARTLDWSGNETLAGDLTIKGNMSVYDNLNGTVTTQTVGGITWTIIKQGRVYDMFAVISVQTTTPTMWGSFYVYRNTPASYSLPVSLTKKISDLSFGKGDTAFWTVYYTDLGANANALTTADIIRPTAAGGSSVDVYKHIRGYV